MSIEKECTLKDLDFHMTFHESCSSCDDGFCHGTGYTENKEFHIHVLAFTANGPFKVTVFNCIDYKQPPKTKMFNSDSKT